MSVFLRTDEILYVALCSYLFLPHLEAPLHSCGLYRHSTENWQCSTSQGRNRRGACTQTLYGRSEKASYRKRVRTGLWWRSFISCDVEIHGPREKRLALHSFFFHLKTVFLFITTNWSFYCFLIRFHFFWYEGKSWLMFPYFAIKLSSPGTVFPISLILNVIKMLDVYYMNSVTIY